MKTNKFLSFIMSSLVAMAYTSCSNSDDVIDTPDPIVKTYTMTVDAQKGSNGTRALSLDGSTLNSTWTKDDAVEVYKGEDHIGTLTAQSTGANTSLKGTLSGNLNVNDNLTLKYLSADYNSQDGTLTGTAKSIDKVCDYSTATVTVSGIAGGNISTTNANFVNQQAVIKFMLKNADGSALPSNPTAFTMSDGTSTVTLTSIPAATYTANGGDGVLYVAFPSLNSSATISLEATVGSDTYAFEKTGITFTNSMYYGVTVKMKRQASGDVISGKFTVNGSGDKVQFSPGNLQFDGTNWKFADQQWQVLCANGSGNEGTATTYPMDLFTWGNIDSPTYNGTTYVTGSADLSGTTDWGSRMGSGWRTLTQAEWNYLFNTRTVNGGTGSGKSYTLGQTVNNVLGVVLYPDDYTGSAYTTGSDWATFESAGCVFLPAAGNRNGSSVGNVGYQGYYWSSTASITNTAYTVYFNSDALNADIISSRHVGFSVRLVRP